MSATFISVAQKITRTYYDFQKTQIHEEAQTDNDGVMNGYFKVWSREGMLEEQGTCKDGRFEGPYYIYSYLRGPKSIAQMETFKKGVLNGPAEYFAFDETLGRFITEKGNYKDGKKDGAWTTIKSLSRLLTSQELEDPMYKDCAFMKYTENYVEGEKYLSGTITYSYYPCNKVQVIKSYNENIPVGKHYYYKPDGNVYGYDEFDSMGKRIFSIAFDKPGCKIDTLEQAVNRSKLMNSQEAEKAAKELEQKNNQIKQEYDKLIKDADDSYNSRRYALARKLYKRSLDLKVNTDYPTTKINQLDYVISENNIKLLMVEQYLTFFSENNLPTTNTLTLKERKNDGYFRYQSERLSQSLYTLSNQNNVFSIQYKHLNRIFALLKKEEYDRKKDDSHVFILYEDSLLDKAKLIEKANVDWNIEGANLVNNLAKIDALKSSDKQFKKQYSNLAKIWEVEKPRLYATNEAFIIVQGIIDFNFVLNQFASLKDKLSEEKLEQLKKAKTIEEAKNILK